jgi:hypothetical protein
MSFACPSCHQLYTPGDQFCGSCGARTTPAPGGKLAAGSLILEGRFRIERLLGEGGMGAVYKATDVRLNRLCALKMLLPELTAHPSARRRMEQEARALARIEHANVVQVRNVFDHAGQLAIELEYMSGGELTQLIGTAGLSEAKALWLMSRILAGLQAIHDAGLVHRDLKAENVLLTADGVPKLTDLGVARDATAGEHTRVGAVLGTRETMAPEQIQGLGVDSRADLYSAGILLFQLLTGTLPLRGSTPMEWAHAHVHGKPELECLRGKASPAVQQIIARALAKAPHNRPQSAQAMKAELDRIHEQLAHRPPPVPAQASPRPAPVEATRAVQIAAWQGPTAKGQALPHRREKAKMIGVDEKNFGQVFDLQPGEQVIGRGADAALQVHGDGVSRNHAVLTSQADGVWLRDLGSVNGTLLNGCRVQGAVRLDPGDVVQVGTVSLKFL